MTDHQVHQVLSTLGEHVAAGAATSWAISCEVGQALRDGATSRNIAFTFGLPVAHHLAGAGVIPSEGIPA